MVSFSLPTEVQYMCLISALPAHTVLLGFLSVLVGWLLKSANFESLCVILSSIPLLPVRYRCYIISTLSYVLGICYFWWISVFHTHAKQQVGTFCLRLHVKLGLWHLLEWRYGTTQSEPRPCTWVRGVRHTPTVLTLLKRAPVSR